MTALLRGLVHRQRSGAYLRLGIEHILFGVDHLLFVFGLLLNVGVEIGQIFFVGMIVALERAFHTLEIRWPRLIEALPGYTVGSLGAYWTIQRIALLVGGLR
jgi:hypothetical protein